MTFGKGFKCHSNHSQQLFDLKKQTNKKQKNKTNKKTKTHAFLRNYHTVYSLTLTGGLLTTAAAEKAV